MHPILWPLCWQFHNVAESVGKDAKPVLGARTGIAKTGVLTYICPCGAEFKRREGELIPEARDWISEHTPHLPPEEQV